MSHLLQRARGDAVGGGEVGSASQALKQNRDTGRVTFAKYSLYGYIKASAIPQVYKSNSFK